MTLTHTSTTHATIHSKWAAATSPSCQEGLRAFNMYSCTLCVQVIYVYVRIFTYVCITRDMIRVPVCVAACVDCRKILLPVVEEWIEENVCACCFVISN